MSSSIPTPSRGSMSSTTPSSSNFHLISNALSDYEKQTDIDLTKNPFADQFHSCDSAEAISELLQDRVEAFKAYRNEHRKLIKCLNPVFQFLHAFKLSTTFGDAVPFPPAKAVFVGIDVLLQAASSVSASYDALVQIFDRVGNFLKRLQIYAKIPFTPPMIDIIVQIMLEILSVLALTTTEIKQGRFKKFVKKIFREGKIETVLQKLAQLIEEETRMAAALTLQGVLESNTKAEINDKRTSTKDILSWLSPPDPSKNHIIARGHCHDGTTKWFVQGVFEEWRSTGSLLWVHGKPGSGKSVLCSMIVEATKAISDAESSLTAYYYFDFRDTAKQDIRGLLTSLLTQLSTKSDRCGSILSHLYSRHDSGSQQPGNDDLKQCLVEMLQLHDSPTIYIIVDALDECPNTSGVEPPRAQVLKLVNELARLRLTTLRLCVTSRPEADIIPTLEPLASHCVSLHDQDGQKEAISDYVKFVVHSDQWMKKWRIEDKELVIDTLLRKADGMFRWVACQLEALRDCLPASLRDALRELPETLDHTYERILLGIKPRNREYAHRLLQCITVSIRPLHVEELAEVLAIRFDAGKPPEYHSDWRLEDAQKAVILACSSLISVVSVDGSRIVEFSHFSVKEFLTSNRLSQDLSPYRILPQPAHTILAQACLCALLRLDDKVDKSSMTNFPLSIYAAQHWVEHARFENVSSSIQELMEHLFDPEMPHFARWVWIYDIDQPWDWVEHMSSEQPSQPEAPVLYYAALCGLHGAVEHLIPSCSQDINSKRGTYGTPLHAALVKGHFEIALVLLEHGADVNALDQWGDVVTL
ncbi:hypothetical protein BGW80DRAFT_1444668 [Lactifluus volemus]|nr:hypothetical protein BGW80DRAFT_1444668 [Lactifluus volemus]